MISFNSGPIILSGSCDNSLRLWNCYTGECLQILYGHQNWIRTVLYLPKSNKFISSGPDSLIKVWAINNNFNDYDQYYIFE